MALRARAAYAGGGSSRRMIGSGRHPERWIGTLIDLEVESVGKATMLIYRVANCTFRAAQGQANPVDVGLRPT
jgi:hypothetical protein